MQNNRNFSLLTKRLTLIAGVDESGCGSLVGPVVASAVVFHPDKRFFIKDVADSKSLNAKKRFKLYKNIQKYSLSWSMGIASVLEIDSLNILKARLLAMQRAIYNLPVVPDLVLIDGNHVPTLKNIFSQCFIKGDVHIPVISAASIIAKVIRDHEMLILDDRYPEYGFAKNKGYPTVLHLKKIYLYGPTIHHRKTFSPVKYMI